MVRCDFVFAVQMQFKPSHQPKEQKWNKFNFMWCLAFCFCPVFVFWIDVCLNYNQATQLFDAIFILPFYRRFMVPCSLSFLHVFDAGSVFAHGKICVDLFINAHLGTFKVEKSNSRNALSWCSEWVLLPEGKMRLLHRPICTENELWLASPSLAAMMLRNSTLHSVLPFTHLQQSFFIYSDFWSLHKIIMDMDLVTFTGGFAGKCWCKKGSESPCCFSIGSLSPPTVQSQGLASWWCLEKIGFQFGSNAAWNIMKRFLGLFLCAYRVKFEHISKNCYVQQRHLPLSIVNVGLFIPPTSAA